MTPAAQCSSSNRLDGLLDSEAPIVYYQPQETQKSKAVGIMRDWLTAEEIAKELQVTGETVRAWCRAGQLRATRVGGRWRIKRSDLDEFLKPNKEVPKKADGLAALSYC